MNVLEYIHILSGKVNEATRAAFFFFFFEAGTLHSEIEEDCVCFVIRKVNVAINPFRAEFFIESKETPGLEIR